LPSGGLAAPRGRIRQNLITRAAVAGVSRSKLEKAASRPWLEFALRPSRAAMMARA
jgi:hypothetical protein